MSLSHNAGNDKDDDMLTTIKEARTIIWGILFRVFLFPPFVFISASALIITFTNLHITKAILLSKVDINGSMVALTFIIWLFL